MQAMALEIEASRPPTRCHTHTTLPSPPHGSRTHQLAVYTSAIAVLSKDPISDARYTAVELLTLACVDVANMLAHPIHCKNVLF